MATAAERSKLGNRASGDVAPPIPQFVIPPLPDKLRRIDPSGADKWHADANRAVTDWIQKSNLVNTNLGVAISKKL